MKKILFINSLYSPYIGGGAEIIFQEQVECFKSKGYHVAVLTTGNRKGITEDVINEVKIYRAGIKNIYWHFNTDKPNKYVRMLWHLKDVYNRGMRKHVRKVIDVEKPDIAVCHNITGFSISVWDEIKAAGLPVVQVLHDLYLMCPNSSMFKSGHSCKKQCRICRIMRKKHVEKSQQLDAVVGVSNYVLNQLKTKGYFKNVPSNVIHNAREIPESPTPLMWNGKEPLKLGYIGTLSRVKGVEWLINQFVKLNINVTLTVAGKGESIEYEKYLKDMAEKDKRINFIGYVHYKNFYPNINILIAPSLWEDTFPTVAIEACAHHVPVIATRMGGLPEIIKDGVNGWLIDANSPDSLGETVMKVYQSPETLALYSQQARKSVEKFLDVKRLTDEYENVFRQIINSK